MAPARGKLAVRDARERINGGVVKDARDRLSQIARKKDARLVLQEKRLNKTFGGDTHLTKSGRVAIVQKGGKIELRTLKHQQEKKGQEAARARPDRGPRTRVNTVQRSPVARNIRADAFAAAFGVAPKRSSHVAVVNEPYRKINQILESRISDDRYSSRPQTRQQTSLSSRSEIDYQEQLQQYQQNRGVNYKPAYMDIEASRRAGRAENQPRMVSRTSSSDVRSRLDVLASDGHKVSVTNLGKEVTEEDIKELFGDIGPLKSAILLRPGMAEIVFVRRGDAVRAIEVYNNRQLDGLPMRCQLHHLDDPGMEVDDEYVSRAAAAFVRR